MASRNVVFALVNQALASCSGSLDDAENRYKVAHAVTDRLAKVLNFVEDEPEEEEEEEEEEEPHWSAVKTKQFLNCSMPTIYRLIRSGELQAYKVRSHWRIVPASARALRLPEEGDE